MQQGIRVTRIPAGRPRSADSQLDLVLGRPRIQPRLGGPPALDAGRPAGGARARACLSFGLCSTSNLDNASQMLDAGVCVCARARAGALMFKIFAILIFSLIMLVIFGT